MTDQCVGRVLRLAFVFIDLYESHLDVEACFLALFDGLLWHAEIVRILGLLSLQEGQELVTVIIDIQLKLPLNMLLLDEAVVSVKQCIEEGEQSTVLCLILVS